jgi:hypothetical protein
MLIQYFSQADQRLCEWRCAFGSAALMIVNTFFLASDFNTDEERQELSAVQLEGYTFLYRDVGVKKNGEVGKNIVTKFYHSFLLADAQRNFPWATCPPDLRSPPNCYYWRCHYTKHR